MDNKEHKKKKRQEKLLKQKARAHHKQAHAHEIIVKEKKFGRVQLTVMFALIFIAAAFVFYNMKN